MRIVWTGKALSDLDRLHAFLAESNPPAAARTIQALVLAPDRLKDYPRMGERLDVFLPQEVRRILIGRYEMRYEITTQTIPILRIWHTREDR